ncbi:MAG: hypothetical protein K8I82_16070 [Anaerolineae bacterium]|nr:hypothetical protein [Anaerolineae bacterium]
MSPSIASLKIGAVFACLLLIFLILIGFRYTSLPHNPGVEFSDSTISRWPDALHFQRSLRDHHTLPLWNPHLMAGQPFAANPGTKVWYPLTWLLLLWDAAFHINAMTAFHLWLGGMGMWCWSRRTGLDVWPAVLAATGYLFAPKLLAHAGAGHLDLLIAAAWLPWMLFFLHRSLSSPETNSVLNTIALAFTGAMLFIGAIQLVLFTFGLGIVYVLFLERKLRRYKNLLLAAGLGMGFAAVQWIPLVELRDAVSRGEIREQDAAIFSLEAGQFVGMLMGDHSGSVETLTYVGISVMILAVVGLILRPRQNRFWWAVIIFAALYSLGENFILWSGLVKIFPPLLWFRVPSRAWFLVALMMPYLAGWGLQSLTENPPRTSRARLGIVALVGVGLSCSVSSLVILSEFVRTSAILGTFFLPLVAICIALLIFDRIPPRLLMPLITVVVAADCLWMGQAVLEGRSQHEWLTEKRPALLENLKGRIYTPSYAIPQQDTAYWEIQRFDGVDPFQIKNFVENSEVATGVPREGYSTTIPAEVVLEPDEESLELQNALMDAEQLGWWGVAYILTSYPIDIHGLNYIEQQDNMYFYENTFYRPFELIWDGPNRVTLLIENSDVYPVVNAPGWQQENGEAVNENLLSLPAKNTTYIYRSSGIEIGLVVSGIAYGVALLWLGVSGFSRFLLPR